jgi:hypothetical protein
LTPPCFPTVETDDVEDVQLRNFGRREQIY